MRAVIWDFDETLARRSGGGVTRSLTFLDAESQGHSLTASVLHARSFARLSVARLERGHPELSDPDRWWDSLRPVLQGALEQAGVSEQIAERASARFRSSTCDWIAGPSSQIPNLRWTDFADRAGARRSSPTIVRNCPISCAGSASRLLRCGPHVGCDGLREASSGGLCPCPARSRTPGSRMDGRRQRRGRHRRGSSMWHSRRARSPARAGVSTTHQT